MLRLLFASLLVSAALGEYSALRASHEAHLSQTSQALQVMHAHVSDALSRTQSLLQATPTQQDMYCYQAMATFGDIWNASLSSCAVVGEVWNSSTTPARLDQVLDTYCVQQDPNMNNLTCEQKAVWAFAQVIQNCSGLGLPQFPIILEDARPMLTASAITCLRDDTNASHFCIKDFIALETLGNGTLTADKLNTVCTACTEKILVAFNTFAPASLAQTFAYFNILCFELNGDRCVLKFQAALALPKTDGAPTDAELTVWCDPCTVAFVSRYVVTISAFSGNITEVLEEAKFLMLTQYVCVKDWNNKYCFPQLSAANSSFVNMAAKCEADYVMHTCGSACAGALNDLRKTLGCCFGTWFNFLQWQYLADNANYNLPASPDALKTYVGSTCNIAIPWGCGQQKIAVALVLSNVKWSWYQNNSAKVQQDIKNWLSYLMAVDVSTIGAINIVQAVNGKKVSTSSMGYQLLANTDSDGIAIDSQVSPGSSDQSQNIQNSVNNNAQSTPNTFANSWDLQARTDPTQPIFVASGTATPVTNPAVSVTPAYFIAFLIASLLSLVLL